LRLNSGKKTNKYSWTVLPRPNEVIDQVHRLTVVAEKYKGIIFMDMDGKYCQNNRQRATL